MSDIKTKVQGVDPNVEARDVLNFVKETDNVYEALAIISKRARQLGVDIKQELQAKLDEFAVTPDTIEEIAENKEQIEISKFYERLPNPALIATREFLEGELYWRYKDAKQEEDEI